MEKNQMRSNVIITFPFPFPDLPWDTQMVSRLRKGANGLFGIAIQPVIDLKTVDTECIFFQIDLINDTVMHQKIQVPSPVLFQMYPYYDEIDQQWVVAFNGRSIDMYAVPSEQNGSWTHLFSTRSMPLNSQTHKVLVQLWHSGGCFPLLLAEEDVALMYDSWYCWTHWRPSSIEQPTHLDLGTAYILIPSVNETGCLLVTCECLYERMERNSIYDKMGPGHWHVLATLYTHNGKQLQRMTLPFATFSVRDLQLARNDFFEWLSVGLQVTPGPRSGSEGNRGYVVAAGLFDSPGQPGSSSRPERRAANQREAQPPQGGVYALDVQGQLWAYHPDLIGAEMSLCVCGAYVVGTLVKDGQRKLWSWNPAEDTESSTRIVALSALIQRVTVVAREERAEPHQAGEAWFWCVEEYHDRIRVVQRAGDDLHERQAIWYQGVRILDWQQPYFREKKPVSIEVYEDRLFILAMNSENQVQILQFQ
jgi:hypothetical protein